MKVIIVVDEQKVGLIGAAHLTRHVADLIRSPLGEWCDGREIPLTVTQGKQTMTVGSAFIIKEGK